MRLITGVTSSSKWVTSTVILAALDEGVAAGRWASVGEALDAAVTDLSCEDVNGPVTGATLRQLLSFTSGMIADHDCVNSNASLRSGPMTTS